MKRLVTRIPRGEVILVLAAYLVTAVYLVTRAIKVHSYIWLVDELLYTKGALGFAGGHLGGNVYGAPESVHAPFYSLLLSPFYGFLNSQHAFKAGHAVDALVFAAVLVPVFLTARHLGARPLMAVLAGLLAVWIPYSAATLVLMSESLAYFTFAWAVWAMVRALSEPTPAREGLALLFIAATAYTRPQFTLLFAVFALAVVLVEVGLVDSLAEFRARVRVHWVLAAAVVVGLLVVLIAGRSLLGGYSHTAGLPRFPQGLWQNMLSHAAHVVVASGIAPAILWLGWAVRAGAARADRRHYAFAVLSALLVVFVFYEVGFFSQNVVGGRIQERTAFYPVLLFALGAAALSVDLLPRGPRLSLVAAGVVVALVIGAAAFAPTEAAAPFEAIANPGASYNKDLQDAVKALSGVPTAEGLALLAVALGVVGAIVTAPRLREIGLPVLASLALLFCVIETTTVLARDIKGINGAIPSVVGGPNAPRAWVDGSLYKTGADAGAVEAPLFGADSSSVWMWVEFWNKRVNRLYVPSGAAYSHLPSLPMTLDPQTGAVHTPLEKQYLVVAVNDSRFGLQGTVFKQGPFGLNILKPLRPYRASWAAINAEPSDAIGGAGELKGKPLMLAVYRPAGSSEATEATVRVRLTIARATKPADPVVVGVSGASQKTRAVLTAEAPSRPIALDVRIPAGAPRGVITFTGKSKQAGAPRAAIGFAGVAVERAG